MVREVRSFLLGFGACIALVGCAGFAYHYYGLEGVTYDNGKLLGPKPQDDLPFSNCAPTPADPHPCVVMFAKDFFAFKLDYEDTQQKLKECQNGQAIPSEPTPSVPVQRQLLQGHEAGNGKALQ